MEIKIEELEKFANDSKNNIKVKVCIENALKVKKKYGGSIYQGNASYYSFQDNKVFYTKGHIWNVINFKSEFNTPEEQIIDIYNYKENREFLYFGYVGSQIPINLITS